MINFKITCTGFGMLPFTRDAIDYFFKLMIVKHANYVEPKRVEVKISISGPLQAVWFSRGLNSDDLYLAVFKKSIDLIKTKLIESPNIQNSYEFELNSKNTDSTPPDIEGLNKKLNMTIEFELRI
jgi:hypothetical protein